VNAYSIDIDLLAGPVVALGGFRAFAVDGLVEVPQNGRRRSAHKWKSTTRWLTPARQACLCRDG